MILHLFITSILSFQSSSEKIYNKHKEVLFSRTPFELSYDITQEETDYSETDSNDFYDIYYEEMRAQNRVNKRKLHCRHRNTRYNEELDKCECFPGYPHGDPEFKPGCWRCEDICHPSAECRYPGRCACPRGFHGDGINRCDRITLNLLYLNQTSGKSSGGEPILIKYEYKNGRKTKAMFCRFGSTYVLAENFTEDTILCKTPQIMPGTYRVAISYNADMWSSNNFTFTFINDDEFDRLLLPVAIIAFLIISVVVITFYGIGTGMIKPTKSESEPFIKRPTTEIKPKDGVRNRRQVIP